MWEEGVCIYGTSGVHNNFPNVIAQSKGKSEDEDM